MSVSKWKIGEWVHGKLSDASAPLLAPRIEITGNFEVILHGCKRILSYTPERITLQMKRGGEISIVGSTLVCSSFFIGAVVIEGRIESVLFSGVWEEKV